METRALARTRMSRELVAPHAIRQRLDDYVIGQARAKISLSIAARNHYARIVREFDDQHEFKGIEFENFNLLLVGPTGCGKTLLIKTLAKILGVPFAIADATKLTESGYVGEDVETVLQRLLVASDWNVEEAQRGIVYIDEIDKKARKGDGVSISRDVSGEGVQQALLTIIGGGKVRVPTKGARKHPEADFVELDTSNILFIAGGAFVGLEKIIEKRLSGTGSIGFGAKIVAKTDPNERRYELLRQVEPQDFQSFGLIPEFIGRFPMVTSVDSLDRKALRRILTEPKNSLLQQVKALLDGYTHIEFSDEALDEIAACAAEEGTGARALSKIVMDVVTPINYRLPDYVKVTREMVRNRAALIEALANDPDPIDPAKEAA